MARTEICLRLALPLLFGGAEVKSLPVHDDADVGVPLLVIMRWVELHKEGLLVIRIDVGSYEDSHWPDLLGLLILTTFTSLRFHPCFSNDHDEVRLGLLLASIRHPSDHPGPC